MLDCTRSSTCFLFCVFIAFCCTTTDRSVFGTENNHIRGQRHKV